MKLLGIISADLNVAQQLPVTYFSLIT